MPISTDNERVRLLISDVGGTSGTDFLFSNNEIDEFLALRGGDVFAAAATALRVIAGNMAQVMRRITFLELSTDGPAVAKELREQADKLDGVLDQDSDVVIAEMNVGPFAARDLRRGRSW